MKDGFSQQMSASDIKTKEPVSRKRRAWFAFSVTFFCLFSMAGIVFIFPESVVATVAISAFSGLATIVVTAYIGASTLDRSDVLGKIGEGVRNWGERKQVDKWPDER